MPQTTTESRQRPTSMRGWSAFFTPKSRTDRPQTSPITRASGNGEDLSPASFSHGGNSDLLETPNARSNEPPSYAHAVSRSEPTSYRFVQESPFSMNLVTQEGSSNTVYNISVGVNVWMPSEHITFVRRHASPDGPVIARLE